MELVTVKIACLVGVFLATGVAALLPMRIMKNGDEKKQKSKFLSFSNCLAGGVFLGTCFIGLFPTVKSKFAQVLRSTPDTDIPVAELTIMCGYFLMLFMEQVAHAFTTTNSNAAKEISESLEMKTTVIGQANGDGRLENSEEEDEIYARDSHPLTEMSSTESYSQETHPLSDMASHNNHGHSHDLFPSQGSSLRRYMLLLALSIHSIFEGTALGLQETFARTMHLFGAIMLHETLVAFAFGVSLAKLEVKRRSYVQMVIFFCLMIPIGVVIGILVGRFHGFAGQLTSAIVQGLAAGTFIYVVFVEILPNELISGEENVWRIVFVFLGFMIFASLQFITLMT